MEYNRGVHKCCHKDRRNAGRITVNDLLSIDNNDGICFQVASAGKLARIKD